MDPDAKVQVATKGTKLEFSSDKGSTWKIGRAHV